MAVAMASVLVVSSFGEQVPPWESTNPTGIPNTKYWGYDFNDGSQPPTITLEGGNSGQPLDPTWTITGSGDAVSIVNGQLGIHNASQPSLAVIRLDVPNTHNNANIKFFWFKFDFSGNTPALDFDTNDPGSVLVPGSLTYTANTTGSHIEGYVNFDPQPSSEWMEISLSASAGGSTWIDNLQTGSTCVPEPASFSLIALGGLGSWLARKKQQRKFRRKKKETKFEELDFALPFLTEEVSTASFGGSRERSAFHLK